MGLVKYILLAIFLLLMAGIAFYSRRRASNSADFMLAGRNVGPWMSAFAYGTSYFSAVIFIGYASDLGRTYGLHSVWVGLSNAVIGCLFAWLFLAARTRRITQALDAVTMPQFLAKRFGSKVLQPLSAFVVFFFLIPYSASVYQGINLLFTAAFGLNENVCYLLIACITAFYVFFGGYFGAALADFFQGLIMIGGVFLLIYVVTQQGVSVSGNLSNLVAQSGPMLEGAKRLNLFWLIFLTSVGALGMPHMIHKFYAIKDTKAIKKGTVISTVFSIIIGCGAYYCGAMGRTVLGQTAMNPKVNIMTAMLTDPHIVPDALLAVFLVLLLSASMSKLSALVLSASSTFVVDLVGYRKKDLAERTSHGLLKAMCLLFIALSLAVTSFHIPLIDLMSYSWGIIAGAFLGPYIWSVFSTKITTQGAWAGFVGGSGSALVLSVLALMKVPGLAGSAPMIGTIGMIVSLVAVPIVSLLTQRSKRFGNLTGMEKAE